VSTAAYKAYDFDLLQSAGLSAKIVEGLLRVKLGYNGVAIACGLETEAVRGTLALEEAAVHALRAGCDMLLLEKAEAAERVQAALSAARECGKLPRPRVEQALKRIRLAKKGLKPPHGPMPRKWLDRVVREIIEFSSDFTGCGKTETRKWRTGAETVCNHLVREFRDRSFRPNQALLGRRGHFVRPEAQPVPMGDDPSCAGTWSF
jgi:beta-glucosidase-like glycosyl hydrolase